MPMFKNRSVKWGCLILLSLGVLTGLYFVPPVHERLSWRLDNLRARIIYAIHPPENALFIPQDTPEVIPAESTPSAPAPSSTFSPAAPPTTSIERTPPATSTETSVPTPIPAKISLEGIVHEYQKWNNCGPANLAMLLSYWGWQGDQMDTAAYLKPNARDNNVMPAEMLAFVGDQTGLKAVLRYGGDLDTLKRLLAGGFPVLVEKGLIHDNGWMGHYQVLSGYDDDKGIFIAQDSLIIPDLPVPYDAMEKDWRVFNDLYLVAYPPERENELQAILAGRWDEQTSQEIAKQTRLDEINRLKGGDLAFAWFSLGTSYDALGEYADAAAAYDKYFLLYSTLPKENRPWRMLWYQNGPYEAYYYTQRYKDVVSLTSITLSALTERLLEEACYWRALAKEKLGDPKGAVTDLEQALERNPHYTPAQVELKRMKASGEG